MNDINKEKYKLYDNCIEMLSSWGNTSFKQKVKRCVRKYLLHQAVAPIDQWFWPQAMLVRGILDVICSEREDAARREQGITVLQKYYDLWIESGQKIYYVDNLMHGTNLLDLYELTGEKKYLDAAERLASYLKDYPADADGTLGYRRKTSNLIFADALGMVCPFLCRYGVLTGREEMVDLGVLQLTNFLNAGMDPNSGLPYHGYDSNTGVKQGCIGWGRAVGWLMMGLCGGLKYLPQSHPKYALLEDALDALQKELWKYQRADGGFSWLLPAVEGPADTSAAAMIAGALLEIDERNAETEIIHDVVSFLLQHTQNGNVKSASGECEGFGQYPQRYGVYPWGNGPVLSVLAKRVKV